MVLSEVDKFLQELEKAELEAPGGVASPQTYAQLLAVYLYQNDLCNAKYLWKRIPADLKSGNRELGQIWVVGQRMWQRDWPAVHVALNAEWSEDVSDIMAALKDNVRERAIILISRAYSSLGLTVFASMTGLTLEEARRVAIERGWVVDGTMVQPCKIQKEESNLAHEVCLTEDQLYKLTQFVSFLEN
ncbi:COP9 signalosome subunit 8 [Bombus vancouverensis nearcticus]|uniref:COP9 signalosome complex subunit 8 n=1 Tax=Bombus bifarius TaxID=103933 RepID=A0A6P8NFD9_9HYME|nr:COP9 signalosome complex subunit 8 [Bombus vancouverensis nearcticus]XP_033318894.1 COP9 signalosome complex subunit 8 [Bombus bifarius]XP_050488613.1 COP9 signalosome complex subunit 8 [Bombus huntii]